MFVCINWVMLGPCGACVLCAWSVYVFIHSRIDACFTESLYYSLPLSSRELTLWLLDVGLLEVHK